MPKKKKQDDDYDEFIIDDDFSEKDLEDLDDLDKLNDKDLDDDFPNFENDEPTNSLNYAYLINKPSEAAKYYAELPNETKISFLTKEEADEAKHIHKTLTDWKYFDRTINLRIIEDEQQINSYEVLKNCKTKENLMDYFRLIDRDYLIDVLEDADDETLNKLLTHVQSNNLKKNRIFEMINRIKEKDKIINSNYEPEINNYTPDDLGLKPRLYGMSVVSMGRGGKAADHSVMVMNATRNEDINKDAENTSKSSFLDTIRKRFT